MGDLFGAMPGRPATRPVAACLEIRDRENDHEVRRVDLHESPMDIGRSPKVKVRLDSPTLSRRHAELSRDPHGHWWLNDLRSRNGTRVNERKVTECQLQNGDEIRIGKFSLRFVDRAANAPEVAADDDAGNSSLRVEDTSDTSIRSWDQAEPVGIDTTHLATLTEFGNRLTRTPDVIERLQALCRLMVRKDFRAISAVVIRISNRNPKAEPRILVDSPTQFEGAGSPHISRGLLTSVLRSRTPAMATNAPRRDLGAIEVSISPDQESLTAVACPLRLGENETDLLYATLPPECTGTDWLALAALVAQQYIQAEQVLAAQRQAQQRAAIEMEMAQAQKIQAHLLAAPPQIDGLDVAIGFEPCRWVGGDYVDVLRTDDGRALLMIADVSGKGLAAALVSAELHAMTHAMARAGADLVTLMQGVNDYFFDHLDDRNFVTALAIAMEPENGHLECINAGHPPALIINDAGIDRLQVGAHYPLGIHEQQMQAEEAALPPGALLALYTDGLSELKSEAGEMLGIDGVGERVRAGTLQEASCDQVAESLSRAMEDFAAPGMAQDDRTFLLARCRSN